MKKFLIITVLMVFSLTIVLAQENVEKIELKMDKFEMNMDEFASEMEDLAEKLAEEHGGQVTINVNNMDNSRVYLGIFPKDLTLEDVRELGYDLNYGVLISGIVPGSSASRQKLFANDIIYEIDGRKVTNDNAFTEILKSYNPGDVANIKLFSAGKHIEKDFTFEAKAQTTDKNVEIDDSKKKKEVDWNSIAINWIPRYYQFDDIEDINGIFNEMGFEDFDDDGLFMNGFGFRIHVGNGYYLFRC
jgi:PDZ domain-containing secreted protein